MPYRRGNVRYDLQRRPRAATAGRCIQRPFQNRSIEILERAVPIESEVIAAGMTQAFEPREAMHALQSRHNGRKTLTIQPSRSRGPETQLATPMTPDGALTRVVAGIVDSTYVSLALISIAP